MSGRGLDVSVIIPTRDRVDSLRHTLAALARQAHPAERYEVIVVDDGGTDSTGHAAASFDVPFPLQVITTGRRAGAGAARNRGSEKAAAPLLLFLDDDIEASPGLIAAHVRAHAAGAEVTTGYLPPATGDRSDFFAIALRGWWEAMFASMRQRGHRYTFRDLLTGNCAIDTDLFRRAGAFDECLACHEDYELGIRLIAAGARFQFVEDAWGFHHETTTLPRSLSRKRAEGRADVQIVRKHPGLWPMLPIGWFDAHPSRRQSVLRRLALQSPPGARMVARLLMEALRAQEPVRLRSRWARTLNDLLTLAYWQGVAGTVRGVEELEQLRRDGTPPAPDVPLFEVELRSGLADVLRRVDEQRPEGVTVRFAGELVGTIAPAPGAEPLRGEHLRASLARELAVALVSAMGRAGAVAVTGEAEGIVASGPLPSDILHA